MIQEDKTYYYRALAAKTQAAHTGFARVRPGVTPSTQSQWIATAAGMRLASFPFDDPEIAVRDLLKRNGYHPQSLEALEA